MIELPTVIDVEASGFGAGSYPIEVGVAFPDGRSWCSLIRPAPDWSHWNPDAEAVHQISRGILSSHGKPVRDIALDLNRLLAGQTVYSDAWGNDRSWLALLFDAAGLSQHFRIDSLRTLLSDLQLEQWQGARAGVIAALGRTRHRASVDAQVIQRTFHQSRGLPALADEPE